MESALENLSNDFVLVVFKEIVKRRGDALLKKVDNPGVGAQIGTFVDLGVMLGEFVIEGCIR